MTAARLCATSLVVASLGGFTLTLLGIWLSLHGTAAGDVICVGGLALAVGAAITGRALS